MKPLTIYLYDNGVYTNWTHDLKSFIKDDTTHTFVSGEDYLYLGLDKKFSGVYVEMETPDTLGTWDYEYYNGTTWVQIENLEDDTKNLTRSGLLDWDREISDWRESILNGTSRFWMRLRPLSDSSEIKFLGIAKTFSNDSDLEEEYPGIEKFRPKSQLSFANYHQAAREDIIQTLKNSGEFKRTRDSNGNAIDAEINEWDLLIEEQFKQASKYLVLSKIFFQKSDNTEDKYFQLYKEYGAKYKSAFNLFYRTIDKDNDGVVDNNERLTVKTTRIRVI